MLLVIGMGLLVYKAHCGTSHQKGPGFGPAFQTTWNSVMCTWNSCQTSLPMTLTGAVEWGEGGGVLPTACQVGSVVVCFLNILFYFIFRFNFFFIFLDNILKFKYLKIKCIYIFKNKFSDGARVARPSLGGAEFNLTADINSRGL